MRLPQVGVGRIAAALLAIAAFFGIAAMFRPEPVSDFLYYWMIADAPALYHKGGVVGELFGPVKGAAIAPYWGAALLNACFAVAAIFAVVPATNAAGSRARLVSVLGAFVVVLAILAAAPAAALVATDLMAFSAFVVGMSLLVRAAPIAQRWPVAVGAVLILAVSASLRPIYAPVMLISAVALGLMRYALVGATAGRSRWKHWLYSAGLGVVLVIGALLTANLVERGLLGQSRMSQYAPGVVRAVVAIGHDIGDGRETCARWSETRARFGLERRTEPLIPFILERQREVGWRNLPALYLCKVSRLLQFRDWFAAWLTGSRLYSQDQILADSMGVDVAVVNEAARRSHVVRTDVAQQAYDLRAGRLAQLSAWIGGVLQVVMLSFLVTAAVGLGRARSARLGWCALGVSLAPALALIGLHGVFFEVQARYAFPIWLLPPAFMMLILRLADEGSGAALARDPAAADVV